MTYGYPWYPFSYGWNPGWYGSGYNAGYNNVPYGYDNGVAVGVNNTAAGNTSVPNNGTQPQPLTVSGQQAQQQGGPSIAHARAEAENAAKNSPELITANSSVQVAQKAYDTQRERVLSDLKQKPEYQNALKRRKTAAGDVAEAKGDAAKTPANTPADSSVIAAARAKLEAGDEVTKMEERALEADPATAAAKARLQQATTDRDVLKAQLTGPASGGK